MIILLVDDHVSVVSGIYSGVRWESIGVSTVLKAYNAYDAKEIIRSQVIDILLCDIEMPGESGLDLLRWVAAEKIEITCIFLTAYADFVYAKEAIRLGCFDYIVQPARYEEIEQSIGRAIESTKKRKEALAYSNYGQLLYQKRDQVLHALLKEHLYSQTENHAIILLEYFHECNIPITEQTLFTFALIHVLGGSREGTCWSPPLICSAITNVLEELAGSFGQKALSVSLDDTNIAALLYFPGSHTVDHEIVPLQLNRLSEVVSSYFNVKSAIFFDQELTLETLPAATSALLRLRDKNVIRAQGVFPRFWADGDLRGGDRKPLNMVWWSTEIGEVAFGRARQRLSELLSQGSLNAESLKQFYQDFMQLTARIADYHRIPLSQVFEDAEGMELPFKSYANVEEMHNLIQYTEDFFRDFSKENSDSGRLVETIIQYVRRHIDQDIRRDDIAKAVHLSPNYISRLFRNKMGCSLKDYIIDQKMILAHSLILSTSLPISVIAAKVGFTNFSYFSQVYKKVNGKSPTTDRQGAL